MIKKIGLVFLTSILGVMLYSLYLSKPLFNEVLKPKYIDDFKIAPLESALTFSRYRDEEITKLLLVVAMEEGVVKGIDLSSLYGVENNDPRGLYNTIGFEALSALAQDAVKDLGGDTPLTSVAINKLIEPMNFSYPHLAVGTNYTDHAEEVYVEDPPFIFPKLAHATGWNEAVAADSSSHLDFEAEVCLVPMSDIDKPSDKATMGLILCNDFTDRWTLLKEIQLDKPMGLTGFSSAKGKPGYLTVGYFLVIPKDSEFYQEVGFQLYVNNEMKQNILADNMLLKPDDIVRQTFTSSQESYYNGDETVSLLPFNNIPAGTIIMTGTAGGVIFKPLNAWNPMLYLKRGDRVVTVGDYLGHLDNPIQ